MKSLVYRLYKSNRLIIATAGSLVGASALTSGLGFVYWWLAARQFSIEAVGLGSAAISAMSLLGSFGMLGLGTLLMGELPKRAEQEVGSIITTALLVATLAGFGLGFGFVLLAPLLSADLKPLSTNPANILLFSAGIALTTCTLVLDQALIGLLKGGLQLWRNGLFAIVKLIALGLAGLWLAEKLGMTIYTTWLLGNVLSLLGLAAFVILKRGWRTLLHPVQWGLLHKMGRAALEHHGLNLALQAPPLAMPVVVTITISAATNAHFYLSWLLLALVFLGPLSLATMLYTAASAEPARLTPKARFTISTSMLIGLGANLVLLVAADLMLNLFGTNYAQEAGVTLRILGFAVFPLIIKDHYVSICRVQNRVRSALFLISFGSICEIVLAAAGALMGGLVGLSLAWILALVLEATFMLKTVYGVVKTTRIPQPDLVAQYTSSDRGI